RLGLGMKSDDHFIGDLYCCL
ncbi:hypothetical protein BVRB_032140, partial [Beta vulgaris subsp. vulgaris]